MEDRQIRPSQQERAVKEFSNHADYSSGDVKKLKKYATKDEMYADPDVEVIVIALPLWLHVRWRFNETREARLHRKVMGHSVAECKEMCQKIRRRTQSVAGRRPPAASIRSFTMPITW